MFTMDEGYSDLIKDEAVFRTVPTPGLSMTGWISCFCPWAHFSGLQGGSGLASGGDRPGESTESRRKIPTSVN